MFIAHHLYFLSGMYFLFWWIVFFIINKKGRKGMMLFGLTGLVLGPLVQQMHLVDWWHPTFVFDTTIKMEDLLFGFAATGTAAGIYSILRSRVDTKHKSISSLLKLILIVLIIFAVFGLFYLFGVHSFWSSLIGFSIPLVVVAIMQFNKLLGSIIGTGILLTIIVLPGYLFGIYLNPTWVQNEWLLQSLSGKLFLGIPIEELIWFFFAGSGLAAFQEIIINQQEK